MSIVVDNIQLMQSERLTDDPDGGGKMSATVIVDGDMNNLFSDRSQLDSIYGRFSLRKFFLRVNTADQDTYYGAFGFISDPPADGRVNVLIFTTDSYVDERSDAQAYVENYRLKSVKTQYTLYGLHYVGGMQLQVFCRAEYPSPDIGDVLCLSLEQAGYPENEQYVSVRDIASRTTQTFTDSSGDFERDVIIINITTALQYEFPGQEDPTRYSLYSSPTKVRFTQVANSSAYYGVSELVDNVETDDTVVKISTPYLSLVPSSRSETPLVDVRAGLGTVSMVPSSSASALSFPGTAITASAGASITRYFGTSYARRSLSISVGGVMLRDDGHGGIEPVVPSDTGWTGTADYETGAWTISKDVGWSASVSATATAAGAIITQGYSDEVVITPANRQLSYVYQLPNKPSPGTVVVDYRALGKWIRLYDQGNGQISGNPGEGIGIVNYTTGSISITLGALPDNESSIIYAWGTDLRARNSSGEVTIGPRRYTQNLNNPQIIPASFNMSWTSGGVERTASSDATGIISGDATGELDYVAGIVRFYTSLSPDVGELYHYEYDKSPLKSVVYPSLSPSGSGQVTFTIPESVEAGSVKASWVLRRASPYGWSNPSQLLPSMAFDDAVGGWIGSTSLITDSIDYVTGVVVLTIEEDRVGWVPEYEFRQNSSTGGVCAYVSSLSLQSVGFEFQSGSPLQVEYIAAGDAVTPVTESHEPPPITFSLAQDAAGPAVPGSVRFTYRGLTYVDRDGSLFHTPSATTNAGTAAGSYNYSTNVATLTQYGTTGDTVSVVSLLTRYVEPGVTGFFFRTQGSPLKAGSFTVRATTLDGVLLTGSADINGVITGTKIKGVIDWETGITVVNFGQMVTAAGNEAEPWYDADFVISGQIWKPEQVDPVTVFVNTVVYRPVPMDPDVLGLDPVRLPPDGRILAFRAGDVAVVHNTVEVEILAPVAGATEDLGRDRLAFIEVRDDEGEPIEAVYYDTDLTAGTLTWADPLNLSAYTMPVHIRHRIEDASRITDVQITGEISLETPVTHDYPASGTFVSSCLIYGDVRSRYTNLFDQETWTGVWSDVLIGDPATGTYNDVVYPIEVTNEAAISERWALVFKSTNTVDVIGEETGVVLSNVSILSDIKPINPVTVSVANPTGEPYFIIRAAGMGGGWSIGNAIRFKTISATRPTWAARCTLPGPVEEPTDSFRYQVYGDASV